MVAASGGPQKIGPVRPLPFPHKPSCFLPSPLFLASPGCQRGASRPPRPRYVRRWRLAPPPPKWCFVPMPSGLNPQNLAGRARPLNCELFIHHQNIGASQLQSIKQTTHMNQIKIAKTLTHMSEWMSPTGTSIKQNTHYYCNKMHIIVGSVT